ncbi:hypothetical protein [Mycobacterium interjectum]|uniref:hypothetical protein n=1 Tax=Mycobacterium interjectum TaxID=33895 RepID=UPI0021F2701F|nr:hypothetical protein [Mycobacterium interjectum]MCV7093340.1 hypothetical protein [Mycobacterium interjectum]
MGNKAVSKQARRAAREAATAAQEEVIRRTKANVEDLAAFFDARVREDGVNVWLAERQQALREQAAQRRAAHRLQCGTALRAMRDRGETLREIGRMAGISEKAVRELIRETESTEQRSIAAGRGAGGEPGHDVRNAGAERDGGVQDGTGCPVPGVDVGTGVAVCGRLSVGAGMIMATGGPGGQGAESIGSYGGFATATAGGGSAGARRRVTPV